MVQWLRLHASTVGALRSLVRELRLYMLHDTAKKKTLPVFKLCLWLVVCYWAAASGLSLGHLVQPLPPSKWLRGGSGNDRGVDRGRRSLGLGWEEAEEGREWGWTLPLPLEFQS